ncbi:hydroxymethylglutaryl-CoA reductase [Aspergillus alliaceus]|uniref:Hydroxymethylglutaryl-CoA reductase n=1 Tax=Petromyces alliaceus TaxID=209559 RepID=A0A5N7CNC2_PETAA|nr:hydroxymethylglutaryl-CoA reductase [Aspergillus alliaceus]
MTRGLCLSFPSAKLAAEAQRWVESPKGREVLTDAFNATSRFARLQTLTMAPGKCLHICFRTTTGDAMGMNMICNFYANKKSAAVNLICGRCKSAVAEATVPAYTLRSILKTEVNSLVELKRRQKPGRRRHGRQYGRVRRPCLQPGPGCVTGHRSGPSAECGEIGDNLHIAVSMTSMEVKTTGGGNIFEAQGAMLDLLGVRGAHPINPGENTQQSAHIVPRPCWRAN